MLGNSNYVDVTGQMEDIFDNKISQINIVTVEKVNEVVAEAKVEPVETGVYLKKSEAAATYSNQSHTHTSFSNDVNISGASLTLTGYRENGYGPLLDIGNLRITNSKYNQDKSTYFRMDDYLSTDVMTFTKSSVGIPVDLNVAGKTNISGDLYVKGVKISGGSGDVSKAYVDEQIATHTHSEYLKGPIISGLKEVGSQYVKTTNLEANNVNITNNLSVGGDLNVSGDVDIQAEFMYGPGFAINSTDFTLNRFLNCENDGAYFAGDVNIDGDLTAFSALNVSGKATFSSDVEINKNLSSSHLTLTQSVSASGGPNLLMGPLSIRTAENTSNFFINGTAMMKITSAGVKILKSAGSQTITHETDEIQGPIDSTIAEIGTFCETNGGIYTGYNEIAETDCICQVKQSTTLNPKIVGIITGENQFASHGDVLVKIVPGTYHLGDILCPDITGKARIATETELQYMMLHAIPRPKITSLDTKIEGTVACFLI